ncbi:Late embryogenesis abundant protein [Vigna unguiculata]|uniref:Late embryogenesis abundant protein n=1 Tax=Vigna unguiculata TaxID=3917 RepID=A0A4D6KTQ9_VIGUN|nr:Late embryogenesis abundant protein [Vigna unguiculata]
MQSTKEKVKNMASAAKEQVDVYKAKIDEKAEMATARTEEERVIAHEHAKANEAKAKMELHEAKARHAAEKLGTKQSHPLVETHNQTQYEYQHESLGVVPTYPSHPLEGNLPRNKHI